MGTARTAPQRRRRIVVAGPLAPFADSLRRDLAGQGYAQDTVGDHMHLLADLSDWLAGQGLTVADLTGEVAERFLRARRAAGRRVGVTGRAIAPTLGYLRRLGVAPHTVVSVASPLDVLVAEYRHFLESERGLSTGTVTHSRVSQFLLIKSRRRPRRRGRPGFLAGWPAQGMDREIWRR